MRVPKLLSLVIATGCYVPQAVKADDAPTNIVVLPTIVSANQDYTVSWESCTPPCEVISFLLVEELGASPLTKQSGRVPSGQDFVTTIPVSLDPLGTYTVILLYETNTAQPSLISAGGNPIFLADTTPTTAVSNSAMSASLTSTGLVGQSVGPPNESSVSQGSPASTAGEISSPPPTDHTSTGTPLPSGSNMAQPTFLNPTSTTSAGGVTTSGSNEPSGASGSTGLSTGAKAGIAIGVVGAALIVLIGAILVWRRRRIQQLRALPDGMPYSHDTGSTNRDLTAEKEMNVINSPVDTLHNGYSAVPNAPHTQSQSQTGSWAPQEERSIIGAAAAAVPYTDAHRRSYGSGYADSSPPGTDVQSTVPPTTASGTTIQRKPVGAMSGTTQHLREPGMSDEEVARLEEEERRLDEAIAEAERKRQLQG